MVDVEQTLKDAGDLLLVDWPSRDVPVTLATAGYTVVVHGGPNPDDYSAWELHDGEVVHRRVGRRPSYADLVYSHRPISELAGIVAMAKDIGASTVWYQSGLAGVGVNDPKGCWLPDQESREARGIVESAGLAYVDDVYIADAVRRLGIHK